MELEFFTSGLYLFLAVLAFRFYSIGVIALLPASALLDPAPLGIGLKEGAYIILVVVSLFGAVFNNLQSSKILANRYRYHAFFLLLLLLVNLAMAMNSGTTLADWLRGVVPFCFLALVIPVYLFVKRNKAYRDIFVSILFASFLFSVQTLYAFYNNELWEENSYVSRSGEWIPLDDATPLADNEEVFVFKPRVTALEPNSTDLLIPLGVLWGFGGFLFLQQGRYRWLLLVLSSISIVACTISYTRSMQICLIVLLGVVSLLALKHKYYSRLMVGTIILVSVFVSTVYTSGSKDVYNNRYLQLINYVEYMGNIAAANLESYQFDFFDFGKESSQKKESSQRKEINHQIPLDSNLSVRATELKIAWDIFLEAPVFGAGLGKKHEIRLDTGFGNEYTVSVGYIHNWVLYALMVGGSVGLLLYSFTLLAPAVLVKKGNQLEFWAVLCVVLLMVLYSSFFAVFRLISFNILLALLWGLALSIKERHTCVE